MKTILKCKIHYDTIVTKIYNNSKFYFKILCKFAMKN